MKFEENPPDIRSDPPLKSRWWTPLFLLCIATMMLSHVAMYRHFVPNQWRGDTGFFAIEMWIPTALVAAYATAAALLLSRRRYVLLFLITLLAFAPCFFPRKIGPEFRFNYERQRYLEAARGGGRFGDQHEATVDGRRLLYWRWISWGIDNAIGVIYDPEDRLIQGSLDELDQQSPDFGAFSDIAHGHLGSSRRMGDGLYLVTHT